MNEEQHLENFRRERTPDGGLSSYPYPWLMPEFWQFPTVSMGIGPMCAIYHARFIKYLEHRSLSYDHRKIRWRGRYTFFTMLSKNLGILFIFNYGVNV